MRVIRHSHEDAVEGDYVWVRVVLVVDRFGGIRRLCCNEWECQHGQVEDPKLPRRRELSIDRIGLCRGTC
jgi:hypothetical protein